MPAPSKDLIHQSVSLSLLDRVDESDLELVARVRAGDRAVFVTIFGAQYTALRDFAAGLTGSVDIAEEIVQDVFVRLWAVRTTWMVRGTIRGYLFGAVRNGAFNARRGARAEVARGEAWVRDVWADATQRAPNAESALEAAELNAAIQRAVAQLPERCREVYILRWRHDLSYAEIAESLGIKIKTVEAQLTKALRVLRRELAAYR